MRIIPIGIEKNINKVNEDDDDDKDSLIIVPVIK